MKEKKVLHECFCQEQKGPRCTFVILGSSGDLACRKLYPALFHLFRKGLMHPESRIIACTGKDIPDEKLREKITAFFPPGTGKSYDEEKTYFLSRIRHCVTDYSKEEDFRRLAQLPAVQEKLVIYYPALPPDFYIPVIRFLSGAGLLKEDPLSAMKRLVIFEKPFGRDLKSFHELDNEVRCHLREHQIFRIDHYAGKDTVQNIFLLRFANRIFEAVWNRRHIDSVQITASEDLGVEDRIRYFDRNGIIRDMFQSHMLEMLSLTAMERPRSFHADAIRDEKVRLIRSIGAITPADVVLGQYASYRSGKDVPAGSRTETFAATRLFIENPRWKGVPFYLRSGKKLACRKTEIHIVFKHLLHSIFPGMSRKDLPRNMLHLHIQPQTGMGLTLLTKKEGPKLCMQIRTTGYDFKKNNSLYPDAYARLLLDCQNGDQTLFLRSDQICAGWELFQEILDQTMLQPELTPFLYPDGSDGPEESQQLLRADGRKWIGLLKRSGSF